MYYYGAFTKQHQCLYVGKSVNPINRATAHYCDSNWKNDIGYFKILHFEVDKEMELVKEYKPLHNKEKYTGIGEVFTIGELFAKRSTRESKIHLPVKYLPTGEIFKSGYSAWKAGLCTSDITNILKYKKTHKYHRLFEFVDGEKVLEKEEVVI